MADSHRNRYHVIILAAGKGERMNSKIPKQFLKVNGRPIISLTTRKFTRERSVVSIVVVAPQDSELYSQMESILDVKSEVNGKRITITSGGSTRHRSVRNGVRFLQKILNKPGCDWKSELVVIHDGVRPFVTYDDISNVVSAAMEHKAAGIVKSTIGTIVQLDSEGKLLQSCDRTHHWSSESPQAFRLETVYECYEKCSEYDLDHTTDCMEVVAKYGHLSPRFVTGDSRNIKITHLSDLHIATAMTREEEDVLFVLANPKSCLKSILSKSKCKVSVCNLTDLIHSTNTGSVLLYVLEDFHPSAITTAKDILQNAGKRFCDLRALIFLTTNKKKVRDCAATLEIFSKAAEEFDSGGVISHLFVVDDLASTLDQVRRSALSFADGLLPSGQILYF